jgi:hypothetical protein
MMGAGRNGDGLVRLNGPERFDEAAKFNQLHALGRHDPLSGGTADCAVVVMVGASGDQRKSLVGIRRGMVVVAMLVVLVVFVWAMPVVTDFAGRAAMRVSVHVAVQQIARGGGRQIDDRQQARNQAISKYVQHGDQKTTTGPRSTSPHFTSAGATASMEMQTTAG